jgi:hypothetical protein
MKTLQIKFVGKDGHNRDVYKTEFGAILKNIKLDGQPTQENLATSLNNRSDGEPDMPMSYKKEKYRFEVVKEFVW